LTVEWVKKEHPFKVGDVAPVCYPWLLRGKKMKVSRVMAIQDMWGDWRWVAFGHVIEESGTSGSIQGEWVEKIEGGEK